MYLLSTARAELHYFAKPADAGGFAILSHVWGQMEQSFQQVQEIQRACASEPPGPNGQRPNPRDRVCEKIRMCCIIAERDGHRWIWNDTCCIDKRHSSELDEAIRCMFGYYAGAAICYAFLADVSSDASRPSTVDEFCNSRWHERGWTLQELIAPRTVVFLSRDWRRLGDKAQFGATLESITRVPTAVLLGGSANIFRLTPAERLSWANGRKTTKVEDRAYSLMGIMGVEFSPIYGEGERAFLRLQERVMKNTQDTSLYSWGLRLPWTTFCDAVSREPNHHGHHLSDCYLMAPTPEYFQRARDLTFDRTGALQYQHIAHHLEPVGDRVSHPGSLFLLPQSDHPTFKITQLGLNCRIPLFVTQHFSVAALYCSDRSGYLGLVLTECQDSLDQNQPTHHPGWTFHGNGGQLTTVRIVELGRDLGALRFQGRPVKFTWRQIHVAHNDHERVALGLIGGSPTSPFRVLSSALDALAHSGWELYPLRFPAQWTPGRVVDLAFTCVGPRLLLVMGRCNRTAPTARSARGVSTQHWASLCSSSSQGVQAAQPPPHNCAQDHISEWPGLSKVFERAQGQRTLLVKISFAPCAYKPNETMVLKAAGFQLP